MSYLPRRLLLYAVALWGSITLNFIMPRLMPGNPAAAIVASHSDQLRNQPNAMSTIEAALGLSHDPLPLQYWHYLVNLAHGDFGLSFGNFPVPVSTIIAQSLPWTVFLVGIAAVLAFLVGTGMGILAAWRRGGLFDSILPPLTLLTGSFPFFFLALLMLYVLGFKLGWFPLNQGYSTDLNPSFTLPFLGDALDHAVLPALSLVLATMGGWLLGMRNTMINILDEDYISMAQARGLTDRRVMLAYAARNALLPQITGFALSLGYLVGGQILIEVIFGYPGVGFTLYQAIGNQDYPLIQALLLIITLCVLLANLVVDLLYARLDPRVRTMQAA